MVLYRTTFKVYDIEKDEKLEEGVEDKNEVREVITYESILVFNVEEVRL